MGHLPGPELIKLLALNGITSDSIIKCIKAMECDACRRSVGPRAPNPASSSGGQTIGQFADNLQADIFYLRDITSKNYPILGIICEATHLHAAIRLESRRPDDVLNGFQDAWFRNFGFPLQLNVDDDGCFKGNFHDAMDDAGVFFTLLPLKPITRLVPLKGTMGHCAQFWRRSWTQHHAPRQMRLTEQ